MSRRIEKCHICKGTGLITVDDWLVKGMTEEQIAKAKEEALADVVPKSEPERLIDKWIGSGELTPDEKTLRLIEALRDEAKRYERYYFNHEYDKLIGEAKAEGAREAIEEIEREITKFGILPDNCVIVSLDTIAELKKKFEEKHGGSQ